MGKWKRTGMCAQFGKEDAGRVVTLNGWVDSRRNLGGLLFVWLRDRSGVMQLVFGDKCKDFSLAESLRAEYVVSVTGRLALRDAANVNKALKTGEIELVAEELHIISKAVTPPFAIERDSKVKEELRLKYRYLDLRRPDMQENLILRSRIANVMRNFMHENGFVEVETPILQKSTPEGARDYIVPSRIKKGSFYALPQSPQIFKQLLMVAGFDRYYQIAKCFRDEDLRADRQPEFTQLDMELSFVDAEDVMELNERLIRKIMKEALDADVQLPLPRYSYKEAMERFGSDKPDTRFGLELKDVSDIARDCGFKVFSDAVKNGGSVRGLSTEGGQLSRKEIDALGEFIKTCGAKGLAWVNVKEGEISSPIAKFLSEEEMEKILTRMNAKPGDVLFFVADQPSVVFTALGALRLELGRKFSLIDESRHDLLWITEFPMFEYSQEEGRYVAMHHPFTSPLDEDIDLLETDLARIRAKAYDIVLNGNEIGGGSIRIHDAVLQERVFQALGFSKETAWNRFGFMMGAFQYGTPPHGGLAYGLDRLMMLLAGSRNIKDVIAFPKVQNASCLMSDAPSEVEQKQLDELGILVAPSKNE